MFGGDHMKSCCSAEKLQTPESISQVCEIKVKLFFLIELV